MCVCVQDELTENKELVQTYRLHVSQDIPQENLAMFYTSYDRWDFAIVRCSHLFDLHWCDQCSDQCKLKKKFSVIYYVCCVSF